MKKWIFVGLILVLSISGASADYCIDHGSYSYNTDGFNTFQISFDKSSGTGYKGCENLYELHYDTTGYDGTVYYYLIGNGQVYNNDGDSEVPTSFRYRADSCWSNYQSSPTTTHFETTTTSDGSNSCPMSFWIHGNYANSYLYAIGSLIMIVSDSPFTQYHATGITNCISETQLYQLIDSNYTLINSTTLSSYNFTIINGESYRLSFDNTTYDFTCNGDLHYDIDACAYCTINIYDNCANLLNGAYTVIYDMNKNMDIVYSGYNNSINISGTLVSENDELRVIWSTWLGGVQKTCYAQFDHPINLFDPLVYWNMDVYVNDNESNPIENANVDFNQDCVINGYPARNKYTDSDGLAEFTQCENKNANLVVSKDGYQTLSTSISGGWYDAYTSTYEVSVVLQSSDSENDSIWDVINNSINDTNATEEPQDIPDVNDSPINVHLYFKDINGNYVTQINDSDPYVRCYYDVIAMKPVNMTLSFQSSLSGYWFTDVYTYPYTIDNNSYGYMNLSNDNFSDTIYMYRAYIRDSSYPVYDRYVYLSVVNQTEQSETHYENLTALCMFANTNKNGSIDYREEIKGYAYVVSDDASLRTVSLELYDNSTFIDYVNLTNSSFDEYDLYEWKLGYTYTLGHNYSLVLKASDGSILDCDNVIAQNLIGNKLTIKVTDSFNHNLDHVYVYVEHYGSINTGYLNYGTFEGLPNGETRYKAAKSGYRSGVWKTVNLTNENEIVTYQLIQEAPTGSIASVRMSDSDVKDLYYPLMYFLFIIILIGALMNVIN